MLADNHRGLTTDAPYAYICALISLGQGTLIGAQVRLRDDADQMVIRLHNQEAIELVLGQTLPGLPLVCLWADGDQVMGGHVRHPHRSDEEVGGHRLNLCADPREGWPHACADRP